MVTAFEGDTLLSDSWGVLRRQWALVVLGLVVGGLAGLAALQFTPMTYESTSSVLVQPTGEDSNVANGRTSSDINLDTEAQIVTSTVVAGQAAEVMSSTATPRELAKQVEVGIPPNTTVLNITFTAATAEEAQQGAEAFGDAYLDNRRDIAEDRVRASQDGLEESIAALKAELQEVNSKLGSSSIGASQRANLGTQRDLLIQQIRAGAAALGPLATEDVEPGAVLTEAQLPASPEGLSPGLVLSSGLFAGLLLGVVAAVIRDRRDRRVRRRQDLVQLGLDVLVGRFALPSFSAVLRQRQPFDEPLRQCRNALLARLTDHRGSLLVASATSGPAGSTAALSLAVTFARSGVSTALVCLNTHQDVIQDSFGVIDGATLADVLRSKTSVDHALHPVADVPHLWVVPPGRDGLLFSELLQDSTIRPVLSRLEELAEVVVLDVAPTSVNADAQTVVTATQGMLLVVTADKTTLDEVVDAMDQVIHVSSEMLGAVLVDAQKPAPARDERWADPRVPQGPSREATSRRFMTRRRRTATPAREGPAEVAPRR